MRRWMPLTLGVDEEASGPFPPRGRACWASTGSVTLAAERNRTRPLRVDQLLVAADLVGPGREVAQGVALAVRRADPLPAPGRRLAVDEVEQRRCALERAGLRPTSRRLSGRLRSCVSTWPRSWLEVSRYVERRGEHDRDRDRGRRYQRDPRRKLIERSRFRAGPGSAGCPPSWSLAAQHVADAAHRVQQARLLADLGLAPQVAHVDAQRVGRRCRSRIPRRARRSPSG